MFKKFFNSLTNTGKGICARTKKVLTSDVAKRLGMFILVFFISFTVVLAQNATTSGVTGLESATTTFRSYIEPIKALLYILAAVVSLVGAFSIYFKMQNGDQDVKKSIMMTVGGCVALIAMAEALPAFFGV